MKTTFSIRHSYASPTKRCFSAALLLLAIAVALLPLTGCAMGKVEQTNQSLTVWVSDPDLISKEFDFAKLAFHWQHPDTELIFAEAPEPVDAHSGGSAYDEYRDVILPQYADQMRAELMGHGGPDLIIFSADTFPNLNKAVASGLFAPLDPFIEADGNYQCTTNGEKEPYNQTILDAGIYRGKQYFIPLTYNVPMVLAGKNTFEKYGVPVNEPISHTALLEEMRKAAETGDFTKVMRRGFENNVNHILFDDVLELDYYRQSVSIDRERVQKLEETYLALRPYLDVDTPTDIYADLAQGRLFCEIYSDGAYIPYAATGVNYYSEPYISPLLNSEGKIAAYPRIMAAVNAYSPNQQNAYDFIRVAMESRGYHPGYDTYYGLPVNQQAFEKWITYIKKMNIDEFEYEPYARAMPEGFFDQLREWHHSIEAVYIDTGLDEQMREWFRPYYHGEQSFESCYTTMESTLEIIASE